MKKKKNIEQELFIKTFAFSTVFSSFLCSSFAVTSNIHEKEIFSLWFFAVLIHTFSLLGFGCAFRIFFYK